MHFAIVVCFEDASRRRFLVARHRERGWELPGGRVKSGEDPLSGALREFEEEIGHRLDDARLVLTQARANGTCHVASGIMGEAVAGFTRGDDEKTAEWRFVVRLSDVSPLAFPEDPYPEIESALGLPIR